MSWHSPSGYGPSGGESQAQVPVAQGQLPYAAQPGQPSQPGPQRRRSRPGKWNAFFLLWVLVIAIALLLAGKWAVGFVMSLASNEEEVEEEVVVPLDPEPFTPPLSFDGFNPSRIIEDEQFFDADAYSLDQISAFIAKWNKGCRTGRDDTVCLAEYVEQTPSFEPDQYCEGGFQGETNDTAANIIWKAAQGCGINPQVLLTTLQKEQGLITASGYRLNESRYAIAMGYACPDHANCDPQYFGFATQVYYAARQFRVYEQNPDQYMVDADRTDFIPYAPGDCGGSEVFVENQATANLYNYTPYQPNEAALAGSEGPCSSFGNLNFYAYFNAWFRDEGVAARSAGMSAPQSGQSAGAQSD